MDNNSSPANSENKLPINLKLFAAGNAAANNYAKLESVLDLSKENTTVSGKLVAKTEDLEQWMPAHVEREERDESGRIIEKEKTQKKKDQPPLPFEFSGDFHYSNALFAMSNLAIDGLNSKGTGTAKLYWKDWYPTIDFNLQLATLDYDS